MPNNANYDMDKQACERLASAIILQAVEDYRQALRKKHRRPQDRIAAIGIMLECENFFRSQWFATLTNVDGETLIRKLKEEHEQERRRREALFAPIR